MVPQSPFHWCLYRFDAEAVFLWNYYQVLCTKGKLEAISLQAYVMHAVCIQEFIIIVG